jgi:hypothetical protein
VLRTDGVVDVEGDTSNQHSMIIVAEVYNACDCNGSLVLLCLLYLP